MTDRYAVFGHPVAHSKSPFIHARFAEQTGQELEYEAFDVAPGSFVESVEQFFAAGGRGLNITVPYKEEAWQLVTHRSPVAELAGAVNTLFQEPGGELCGENTDGVGMVRDILQNHGGSIRGRNVLILGAGGAVRGVLPALLAQQPAAVTIANRTVSRAQKLAEVFQQHGSLKPVAYEALEDLPFDLIINGTSAGLQGELPPLPDTVVGPQSWCYDMIYGPGDTVFQAWARQRGAQQALDGCGMLVEQAAQSFSLWRGVMPETAPVIAALRELLR